VNTRRIYTDMVSYVKLPRAGFLSFLSFCSFFPYRSRFEKWVVFKNFDYMFKKVKISKFSPFLSTTIRVCGLILFLCFLSSVKVLYYGIGVLA